MDIKTLLTMVPGGKEIVKEQSGLELVEKSHPTES
jgi:hypothetical protein